jgi:hypothetical protein
VSAPLARNSPQKDTMSLAGARWYNPRVIQVE